MRPLPPHIQAERIWTNQRRAHPAICPRCFAPVLEGLDSDTCAIPTRIDPNPITHRPPAPGDYALYSGQIHYLDQPAPGRTVYSKHHCTPPDPTTLF